MTIRGFLAFAVTLFTAIPVCADDSCSVAANKAMDLTVAATITLATATKYMSAHDDQCDGTAMSLERDDGAAVDKAWFAAIDAQRACSERDQDQVQMSKLIQSLHNRRLRIDARIAGLRSKCE
jgi:hypothetical protein